MTVKLINQETPTTINTPGELVYSEVSDTLFIKTQRSGIQSIGGNTGSLSGYVPTTRTLTINGVTYDLSADRSWTVTAGLTQSQVLGMKEFI